MIASHARCAKFVYPNTIKSFLRAFFKKSENLYLTNFPDKSIFGVNKKQPDEKFVGFYYQKSTEIGAIYIKGHLRKRTVTGGGG